VAAGGYPTLTVNARPLRVDGGGAVPHLIPDQSNYDKTVLYDGFDVTRLVRSGRPNVLAAELGRGWYGLTTPDEWYWQMADYRGAPRVLAELVIKYADGSSQTVATDPATWRTTDGPTTFDSIYTGEKYDGRIAKQLGAWRSPAYDDSGWQHAGELNPPGSCTGPKPACHGAIPDAPPAPTGFTAAALRPQTNPPVLINATLHPVAVYPTYPGSHDYIFDFGQIVSGWPHLHLTDVAAAKAGRTIRMRQDELLNGTGTTPAPYWLVEGSGNVDGDVQTDYYTTSSELSQDWEPSFGYSGFRYVEVRGLDDVVGHAPAVATDANVLTAKVARSGFATTGWFGSSNALLDRIWRNARWAEANNSVAKETDTPTREKNGWTGDGQAGSEAEMLDFDMSRFFAQWLDQFPDSQISTGEISKIVPAAKGGYGYDQTPGWNFVYGPLPAWDAALFVIPWELHTYYGNDAPLARLYATQKRLMDYYAKYLNAADGYSYRTWLGEYGSLQTQLADPVTPVINQQYYFYFADYMAKVAGLLGETQDAAKYRALADAVKASFIAQYWNPANGSFTGVNVESVNAMAIAFGMMPGATAAERAANEASAAAAIALDIRVHANHIGTGVYGLHYLFGVLDRFGYTDVAYSAATQTTPGSYGHQIAEGATSLWELWEVTPAGTFSHDHHYYSSINTWFYQGLAGIQPASPGYRSVRIIPHVPSNTGTTTVPMSIADELSGKQATLDHVKALVRTPRGRVSSTWQRRADGRIALSVCIPTATPAEVWVPTMGKAIVAAKRARFVRHDAQGANLYDVYSVDSGCSAFNR
jgi:alpha-L-rhamnosidase